MVPSKSNKCDRTLYSILIANNYIDYMLQDTRGSQVHGYLLTGPNNLCLNPDSWILQTVISVRLTGRHEPILFAHKTLHNKVFHICQVCDQVETQILQHLTLTINHTNYGYASQTNLIITSVEA